MYFKAISQDHVTAEQINESVLKEMLKQQRNIEALEKLRSLEVFSMDSLSPCYTVKQVS
jgi:hypothetical protein